MRQIPRGGPERRVRRLCVHARKGRRARRFLSSPRGGRLRRVCAAGAHGRKAALRQPPQVQIFRSHPLSRPPAHCGGGRCDVFLHGRLQGGGAGILSGRRGIYLPRSRKGGGLRAAGDGNARHGARGGDPRRDRRLPRDLRCGGGVPRQPCAAQRKDGGQPADRIVRICGVPAVERVRLRGRDGDRQLRLYELHVPYKGALFHRPFGRNERLSGLHVPDVRAVHGRGGGGAHPVAVCVRRLFFPALRDAGQGTGRRERLVRRLREQLRGGGALSSFARAGRRCLRPRTVRRRFFADGAAHADRGRNGRHPGVFLPGDEKPGARDGGYAL